MKIKTIFVDELPKNCGECYFLIPTRDCHRCYVIHENDLIIGNPIFMTYRRSDCPLKIEKDTAEELKNNCSFITQEEIRSICREEIVKDKMKFMVEQAGWDKHVQEEWHNLCTSCLPKKKS